MNTYIKTLLDSFGNQLFPRTRVDAVYLEDNTTELGDHLQTKQDAPTLDKTTPVDGDKALIYDSADSNVAKKLSWANIKATLKIYFDTHYNIGGATAKTTPVDDDQIGIADSATSNTIKKVTFTNLKAFLKTYFDTLYNNYVHPTTDGSLHVPANSTTNNNRILKANGTAGSYAWTDIGVVANGLTAKATPIDADSIMVVDSAASNVGKKTTITQFKAILKTYFDTLYGVKPTNQATATSGQILTSNGGGTATYVDFSGGGQLLGNAVVKAIAYNAQTINENITIPSTYNAMSAGPITIADTYVVTLEDGANWVII